MTSTNDLSSAKTLVGRHQKNEFKVDVDIKTLKSRITASMLLHALGDTIGYRNGKWEFNLPPEGITGENLEEYKKTQYDPNKTRDRIYEFLELGGVNDIDLYGWRVSDDTVLNYATATGLSKYHTIMKKEINDEGSKLAYEIDVIQFCDVLSITYVEYLSDLVTRDIGDTTLKVLKQYSAGETWRDNPPVRLNETMGAGNGAAIRTIPLGLAYWSEQNRAILVIMALEASRIIHNHPVGYLGGICSALFTAFAIEGRPINTWPGLMTYILKGDKSPLRKHLGKTKGLKEYDRDSGLWWTAWEEWDAKFTRADQYENRIGPDPVSRIKWFRDHLGFRSGNIGFVGRGGHDSVIIAFDSLIRTVQSGCGWEKLLYLSALHSGDSDSTACIAGAWYGAMFGLGGVPANMLQHLEYRKDIERVSGSLFKISSEMNY